MVCPSKGGTDDQAMPTHTSPDVQHKCSMLIGSLVDLHGKCCVQHSHVGFVKLLKEVINLSAQAAHIFGMHAT
jgi:hypothetical protein